RPGVSSALLMKYVIGESVVRRDFADRASGAGGISVPLWAEHRPGKHKAPEGYSGADEVCERVGDPELWCGGGRDRGGGDNRNVGGARLGGGRQSPGCELRRHRREPHTGSPTRPYLQREVRPDKQKSKSGDGRGKPGRSLGIASGRVYPGRPRTRHAERRRPAGASGAFSATCVSSFSQASLLNGTSRARRVTSATT